MYKGNGQNAPLLNRMLIDDDNNGGFDPFADLLSAQASRPANLYPVNLRTLTPMQRALLSIDGTVTKFLEAYLLEPIESVLLAQQTQRLQTDHPWLALAAPGEIVARQVLLRGVIAPPAMPTPFHS